MAGLCRYPDRRHVHDLLRGTCSPSSDIYRPLWRFWGIVLGVLTTGFVFLFLWPEYASDKLIESLDKLIRTAIAFGKEVAEGRITEERIAAVSSGVSARICSKFSTWLIKPGSRDGAALSNSGAGIDAATIITRIAYRFEIIARGRLSDAEAMLPNEVLECRTALEQRFYAAFQSLLERLKRGHIRSACSIKPTGTATTADKRFEELD